MAIRDPAYLEQVRAIAHVTPEYISNWPVIVATTGEHVVGFTALCMIGSDPMLDHLWIEPGWIGKGLGRALFKEATDRAAMMKWSRMLIASDPYAEPFYLKMGAKRVGERESKIKKGFYLPLLELDLQSGNA